MPSGAGRGQFNAWGWWQCTRLTERTEDNGGGGGAREGGTMKRALRAKQRDKGCRAEARLGADWAYILCGHTGRAERLHLVLHFPAVSPCNTLAKLIINA